MDANSRKPEEWMGITIEPSYRTATSHVHVLLFKGHVHLPCLICPYPTLFHPTLPCLLYLAPTPLYVILPCPTLFTLPLAMHANN